MNYQELLDNKFFDFLFGREKMFFFNERQRIYKPEHNSIFKTSEWIFILPR